MLATRMGFALLRVPAAVVPMALFVALSSVAGATFSCASASMPYGTGPAQDFAGASSSDPVDGSVPPASDAPDATPVLPADGSVPSASDAPDATLFLPNLLGSGDGSTPSDPSPQDDATAGFVTTCASETQIAERLPLDLLFLIDRSGSMDDLLAERSSKWDAVTAAIAAFVGDPDSSGLGVALQYFPRVAQGVPEVCTVDADCAAWGPCVSKVCASDPSILCLSDADCDSSACLPVGGCAYDKSVVCGVGGPSCSPSVDGFARGACGPVAAFCAGSDSCVPSDYATPDVGFVDLPSGAAGILDSLARHSPTGGTPTAPALEGAVDAARQYASSHPGHTVAAVLATDGLPNEALGPNGALCQSVDDHDAASVQVAQIAAAGLAGTPSIKTFAIGVFAPDSMAEGTSTLDGVATAGGTAAPFLVETSSGHLEEDFEATLDGIRAATLPCHYALPKPQSGAVDFQKINVQFTDGGGAVSTLSYVEDAAGCTLPQGGWYYDVDPAEGSAPTGITLCAAACGSLSGGGARRIDIVLGCDTVIR